MSDPLDILRRRWVRVNRVNSLAFAVTCGIGIYIALYFSRIPAEDASYVNLIVYKTVDSLVSQIASENGSSPVLVNSVLNILLIAVYSASLYAYTSYKFSDIRQSEHYVEISSLWADSLYFVGFILTLVALMAALVNVKPGSGNTLPIVQNAIALSSTVTGIFIRSLWIQFISRPTGEVSQSIQASEIVTRETDPSNGVSADVADLQERLREIREGLLEISTSTEDLTSVRGEVDKISAEITIVANRIGESVVDGKSSVVLKEPENIMGARDIIVDLSGKVSEHLRTRHTVASAKEFVEGVQSELNKLTEILK